MAGATENAANASSVALAASSGDDPSLASSAETADEGKFIATVGSVDKRTRMVVQAAKDQSQVWQEVSHANLRSNAATDSDTFTANYAQGGAVQRLEPYVQALQEQVARTERIVGVVVCVNGKPESMDVFESTPLFVKLWPKLLKSYALDAANATIPDKGEQQGIEVCTRETAQKFLDEAMNANVEGSEVEHGIAVTTRSNERIVTFQASESGGAVGADMGGFGGGMSGGGVHAAAYSK